MRIIAGLEQVMRKLMPDGSFIYHEAGIDVDAIGRGPDGGEAGHSVGWDDIPFDVIEVASAHRTE